MANCEGFGHSASAEFLRTTWEMKRAPYFELPGRIVALKKKLLQLNQSAACRIRDGFRSADDIHLGENAFYVRLHRALADKKGRTNFLVAFSLSHQFENIDFAFTQTFTADSLR